MTKIALCPLAEVPADRPVRVKVDEQTAVAVFKVGASAAVTADICPHQGALLSDHGELDGDTVICLWHGCVFDLRTGEASDGPCSEPLEVHDCEVDEGIVYLTSEPKAQ